MPDSLLLQLPNTYRAFYGSFPRLHRAQRAAVTPICQGLDLVLQAATGSGKSEAVLAPCLERVISSGRKHAVLYIIPTRALAMDLKRRFETVITERLGLNLAIRTGDIKRAGGKRPDIMFTTPESLDVMLGSMDTDLKGFLLRVKTVIIDEVHPLIHQYRGRHLAYLFTRLERRTGRRLQKIAMSATIARVDAVMGFLGFKDTARQIITSVNRQINARLLHIKQEESEIPALLNDLYDTWQYRKILIFVNSRAACDRLFGIVNQNGKFARVSELHYSNLKPGERKKAEKRFRTRPHALCIATSTLELGIDVGDVDAVLLYQPPESVSAFLQRIGRSNRRGKEINFWGLCCGHRSGDQVVRFVALLELSRKGRIESPCARTLPSVLSQQVISCLYEKKRISLGALQSLFPDQRELLPSVFAALEKKGWLKRSGMQGLFGGGWQYRKYLFDYKIWGNFPEAEDEYVLLAGDKAIADIPQSIVAQMDIGDRVFISGRRLRILKIDAGKQKSVFARPSMGRDEKQLAWIGKGPHISYEVAQAMGVVLKTGHLEDETCLFSRTKALFSRELEQGKRSVVLENGIAVVPGKTAPFRYCTFLGSAGNLVLEWCIRDGLADDELFIASDEIGVECSHWIAFEKIKLPVNKKAFRAWIKRHFKIVSSLIPLNLFCKTLPDDLIVQELTDFLFDDRVARTFARYLNATSKIVSGDMAALAQGMSDPEPEKPVVVIDGAPGDSLLALEKEKSRKKGDDAVLNFLQTDQWHRPCLAAGHMAVITGTMIGDYFFHAQCQRRFCFQFLGLDAPVRNHDDARTRAMDRGIAHEKQVLDHIREQQGATLVAVETSGSRALRFKTVLTHLNAGVREAIASGGTDAKPVFFSQCLLTAILFRQDCLPVTGMGVPDLLALSVKTVKEKKSVIIEVGDIKSSPSPGYHHKWQVAFYALLLEEILNFHGIAAKVADTGFLITGSYGENSAGHLRNGPFYETHRFDLKAYRAAFPTLLKTIHTVLSRRPSAAHHRLESHCVSCDGFPCCYQNALENEEIQFLPGITTGELLKLRQMGCTTMAQTHTVLEKTGPDLGQDLPDAAPGFTLEQQKKLSGACVAFLENRIFCRKQTTRLFPGNISRAFCIHVEKDPLTGLPQALGWQVLEPSGNVMDARVWTMEFPADRKNVWDSFADLVLNAWEASIVNGNGPHIFHFGSRCRLDLLQWGERCHGKTPSFLWQTQPSPWTDLRRLFTAHFDMPVPGVVSLFTLGHLFGCRPRLDPPRTLFHHSGKPGAGLAQAGDRVKSSLAVMGDLYSKARLYLKSQWTQEWECLEKDAGRSPYIRFIKEEERLQEADILALQERTLEERVRRFRAIGHLQFDHTCLDHEGRFLYTFKTTLKTVFSKFRKGDFLKLAPHGMADLQAGFPVVLAEYDVAAGAVSLLSRSGKIFVSKTLLYSLEEDTSDWHQAKLTHAATALLVKDRPLFLPHLLAGQALDRRSSDSAAWLKKWLMRHDPGLNVAQGRALALPFEYRTSMIQGPPGTGKTHLLGWILIALILQAHDAGRPLRIGVSALTHQAIDTVLKKVTFLVNRYLPGRFPGHCVKWGQAGPGGGTDEKKEKASAMAFSEDAGDVLGRQWLILGATGYGFYSLFNSRAKGFPSALDWVVFDEASQVPVPQALLSLIYGRGNFLFTGDVHQLPPIIRGVYGELNQIRNSGHKDEDARASTNPEPHRSILANLQDLYPKSHQVTLDTTYRMNQEICAFPAKLWYDNQLFPAPANAHARLALNPAADRIPLHGGSTHLYDDILDGAKPVVLVLTDHQGCFQRSDMEAHLMAALAHRLMMVHGISPDRMALISPHRTQNNAIAERLGKLLEKEEKWPPKDARLPLVDTIERVQGAERDVIMFGITASDPDHLLSDFLNSPNRLNVAMTRAKTKLIIMGSQAFFSMIPDSEALLEKNYCYKALLAHCRQQNAVFHFPPAGTAAQC